jgi:hypothetical protein
LGPPGCDTSNLAIGSAASSSSFELAVQLLAVFIQLLQRFIAVHKVMIRGFAKLHVLNALMRQLLIFIFKYLTGILFSVDNVLQIISDAFSWSTRALSCAKSSRTNVRLP